MPSEAAPTVDETAISAKMGRLNQYLKYLHELRKSSPEEFREDFRISGATERYLQVAIECIIDIGNEIISSLQLRRPTRYRDIPHILSEAKIIPKDFAETIASMISFRNLLVHDYAEIDLELVYEFLQKRLQDFETFMKYITQWLKETQTQTKNGEESFHSNQGGKPLETTARAPQRPPSGAAKPPRADHVHGGGRDPAEEGPDLPEPR